MYLKKSFNEINIFLFALKDNPNLVPSFEDRRYIGCQCEEDQTALNYMWVHAGEPKRCECGYWFKLVPAEKFWEKLDTKLGA